MNEGTRTEKLFGKNLNMYPHLKYIRDKLWLKDGKSRVSVMVGAGFSLNANMIENSLDKMSDWPKIKERLIERLPHHNNIESENVLDIGQIYVDEYGRTSLDEILKISVPDNNYEPSELHYDLLRLPWSDIYTTNYDTLLERTRSNLYERSYEVIYDISDIPGSNQPRIIKLHGSFPAQRPFVFTKSDYERYPIQFSPFVNMVQQSIMETTFLLIGFSGDDPNFEQWTSWVSQNLGEHMPKIYMIGIGQNDKFDDLRAKGITLIDFEEIYKTNSNKYQTMFKDLFEFFSFENKQQKTDWPYKSYTYLWSGEQESIFNKIELFKYNRESYPNWIIIPDVIRRKYAAYIRHFTEEFFQRLDFELLKNEENFESFIILINELIWCYKTFVLPIGTLMHITLKKIIELCDNIESVAEIILVLLKESRLDCDFEGFKKYKTKLSELNLTIEQHHEFIYERVQLFLFFGNIKKVEEEVFNWNIDANEVGWTLKKAIILNRIQNRTKSIELVQSSLQIVRRLLTIQPDDYRLLSFESVILNSNLLLDDQGKRKYDKDRSRYLYNHYCNTDREFNQIALSIKPYEYQLGREKRKGFDLDTINISYSYGDPVRQELLDSYALININEIFGYECSKSQYDIALNNIEFFFPFLSIIKRINLNNKSLDDIVSREYIYNLELSELSMLLELSRNVLNHSENIFMEQHIAIELISRIYFALSRELKLEIDSLALNQIEKLDLYSSRSGSYRLLSLKSSLEQLTKRIFIDKNGKEQSIFLGKMLNIPIKYTNITKNDFDPKFYFDPILSILDHLKPATKVIVSQDFITYLFGNLQQDENWSLREASIIRIFLLIDKNALPQEFVAKFRLFIENHSREKRKEISKFLWDNHIENVISTNKQKDIRQKGKIANNFLLEEIPSISFDKTTLKIYLRELSTIFPDYVLSKEQPIPSREKYKNWLLKFFEWWDSQKIVFQKNNINPWVLESFLEVIVTLKNNILGVIPKQYLTKKLMKCIENFFLDFHSFDPFHSLYLLPSFIRLNIKDQTELLQIITQLNSKENEKKIVSLNCLYDYLIFINKNEISEDSSALKKILFDNMRYTSKEVSTTCYNLLHNLFKCAPELFNKSDMTVLKQHLSYCLKEIQDGSLIIKNLEDFELISAMAGVASYSFTNELIIDEFNGYEWKEYITYHKLPEVRQYSDAFDTHSIMRRGR